MESTEITLLALKFRTCRPSREVARDNATYAWPVEIKIECKGRKGTNQMLTLLENLTQVNLNALERLTLRFVDRHRPSKNERNLDGR